jgi:hypothetical protein
MTVEWAFAFGVLLGLVLGALAMARTVAGFRERYGMAGSWGISRFTSCRFAGRSNTGPLPGVARLGRPTYAKPRSPD